MLTKSTLLCALTAAHPLYAGSLDVNRAQALPSDRITFQTRPWRATILINQRVIALTEMMDVNGDAAVFSVYNGTPITLAWSELPANVQSAFGPDRVKLAATSGVRLDAMLRKFGAKGILGRIVRKLSDGVLVSLEKPDIRTEFIFFGDDPMTLSARDIDLPEEQDRVVMVTNLPNESALQATDAVNVVGFLAGKRRHEGKTISVYSVKIGKMSASDIALSVRNLSKSYTIGASREKQSTLAETVLKKLRSPFRRDSSETFWALKDVSFDIKKGEVVGVIGRNGAGKSTLLKVLSRITEPTGGQIDLYGRVGSLLEVGTGFHPELSGRENIYLNGAILGMTRGEIHKAFDAIVEFAGVEKFLDTPVKRYSSGMYVRLAFAVAAHLRSEILVVDEVLSVGDSEFQSKCIGKMKEVSTDGRTVLFVSHHMQSVQVLCNRGIYLEKGRAAQCGTVAETIDRYVSSFARTRPSESEPDQRPGSGEFRFLNVIPSKQTYACGEEKRIEFTLARRSASGTKVFISAHVLNEFGVVIAQCDSRLVEKWFETETQLRGYFTIRTPWFKAGQYRVEMFICNSGVIDRFEDACRFEVLPLLPYKVAGNDEAVALGVVHSDFEYACL